MNVNEMAPSAHRVTAYALALSSCLVLAASAATPWYGDYTINPHPSNGEYGNLNVSGGLTVGGAALLSGGAEVSADLSVEGMIDFGSATSSTSLPAVMMQYVGGTEKGVWIDAIDPLATFLWRDNGVTGTQRPKMKLSSDNILSLYNSAGSAASITLQGGTGQIHLTGTGSGIYSGGTPVFSLGAGGEVAYGSGRPLSIANTTASSSSTTGALTVAGGIGASKDSFINGLRIGRGNGSVSTNVALGPGTLLSNTTGNSNAAVGSQALSANTTGYNNTAMGASALAANSTGRSNSAVGRNALTANSTGNFNTAVGDKALSAVTSGASNTGIGYNALSASTGNSNSAVGNSVMASSTTGYHNSALGTGALAWNTTGSFNIAIGSSAGNIQADGVSSLTDPEQSIYIGYGTRGYSNEDIHSVVIGSQAIGEGPYTTVIGSMYTTSTHLFGETKANSLKVSGKSDLNNQVVVEPAVAPATAVRAMRVLADGTILVKPGGDLSMGGFTAGAQP